MLSILCKPGNTCHSRLPENFLQLPEFPLRVYPPDSTPDPPRNRSQANRTCRLLPSSEAGRPRVSARSFLTPAASCRRYSLRSKLVSLSRLVPTDLHIKILQKVKATPQTLFPAPTREKESLGI